MKELTINEVKEVSGGWNFGANSIIAGNFGAAFGGYIGYTYGPLGSAIGSFVGGSIGGITGSVFDNYDIGGAVFKWTYDRLYESGEKYKDDVMQSLEYGEPLFD